MRQLLSILLIAMLFCGCGSTNNSASVDNPEMKLISQSFKDGEVMPIQYTCKGADISPQLAWTAIPAGTKSFAIVCRDIDAPNGEFIHWIIYNISPVATRLLENQPKNEVADNSASQGQNDFGKIGWNGPCPPIGKPHKYVFTVYSLDQKLNLAKQPVIMKVLDEAMKDHVIAKASITCTFQTTKK